MPRIELLRFAERVAEQHLNRVRGCWTDALGSAAAPRQRAHAHRAPCAAEPARRSPRPRPWDRYDQFDRGPQ
ncbi:hypothetical protein SSBG_02169 [Streptomyces sp. SPB074]|nr:hypothetical protein SSBG_02169 [Streptomyces sp. SPB074]